MTGPLVPRVPGSVAGCAVGRSQTSVLVTEWSSAEKANLEAAITGSGGAIAVAFSGCELRLLPACHPKGAYAWQRTSIANDRIEIHNEAELNTKLPLGAISLSAELKKSGELAVETTISGQARLQGMELAAVAGDPACADATHVVAAVSMGAFTMTAGGSEGTNADLSVHGIGTTGKLGQSAKVVRGGGQASACASSTEQGPAQDCSSPVQVFLSKVPGRGEQEGPPGTARVDFVSTNEDQRWDVYVNDQVACTTPCTKWVDPMRPIILRSRDEPFLRGAQKLEVPRLPPESLSAPLQVRAEKGSNTRWWFGIACLGEGGALLLAGGLTAFSSDSFLADTGKGMLIAGTILTGLGAYLYVTSRPHVQLGPGFVAGTF